MSQEGGGGPERRRGKPVRKGDGGKLDPVHENMVTDWLAGRSFFDHMVLAASGDG